MAKSLRAIIYARFSPRRNAEECESIPFQFEVPRAMREQRMDRRSRGEATKECPVMSKIVPDYGKRSN